MCYVFSGLCDELITRSVDSYSMCVCLTVGDLKTLIMRLPRTEYFRCAVEQKESLNIFNSVLYNFDNSISHSESFTL